MVYIDILVICVRPINTISIFPSAEYIAVIKKKDVLQINNRTKSMTDFAGVQLNVVLT